MDEQSSPPDPVEAPKAGVSPFAAGLRVAGAAALIVAVAFATALAIVWFVPEGNDYGKASVLKHERLASLPSPKIVLVGGSNLAFGMDTRLIESETGCPAVNMGMNGFFGIRFMLNEVRGSIRAGDIVVLAFELDNFFKSVDGSAPNLIGVIKPNPMVAQYLESEQLFDIVATVPRVAHVKAMRLVNDGILAARAVIKGEDDVSVDLINVVERADGFTETGDLVSHLGVEWPYGLEAGTVSDIASIETEALDLMAEFSAAMEQRGARVMTSFTPVRRAYFLEHEATLLELNRRLEARAALTMPSPITHYVFSREEFFDTVYHLDAEGREERTRRVIADLRTSYGDDLRCNPSQTAAEEAGIIRRAQ